MKRFWLPAALATFGLTLIFKPVDAQAEKLKFHLVPASAPIAACLPNAEATVTVHLTEAQKGVDRLHLHASGLPPDVDFAVFLTSADAFATPPFGAVEYIGDFTTNAAGSGSLKVDAIIAEAFSSTVDTTLGRVRKDLDHLVFWFADPADAKTFCNVSATTPFDGDGVAGPAAMSSQGATGLEQFPE